MHRRITSRGQASCGQHWEISESYEIDMITLHHFTINQDLNQTISTKIVQYVGRNL